MEHKKTYFITGIDTDAGKTWVTGAFARYLVDRGQSVVTQKIAQTGCVDASEDIERHRLMMGIMFCAWMEILPVWLVIVPAS